MGILWQRLADDLLTGAVVLSIYGAIIYFGMRRGRNKKR
jgi:hypothetical protein